MARGLAWQRVWLAVWVVSVLTRRARVLARGAVAVLTFWEQARGLVVRLVGCGALALPREMAMKLLVVWRVVAEVVVW